MCTKKSNVLITSGQKICGCFLYFYSCNFSLNLKVFNTLDQLKIKNVNLKNYAGKHTK